MNEDCKVGVFDSGIGGLTVLRECMKRAPWYSYYYYGDNVNAPYGIKTREEITRLVRRALRELEGLGIDAAVLACNTATAVCAEEMRSEFSFPVVGMEPAVKPAGEHCHNVLVLATPRTAESDRLKTLVAHSPHCRFTVYPASGLAGAIETCLTSGKKLTLSDHLPQGDYDGIVLGCTHYVYLKAEISAYYGGIPVFDGNAGTANRLVSLMEALRFGKNDHRRSENTNVCLYQNLSGTDKNKVDFVGSGGKINEILYKSEQMFH